MADRKERIILDLDPNPYLRGLGRASAGTAAFVKQLDSSNDRASMLTQSLIAVGPALTPIASAGIPAVAGLSTQLGFAAAGAGVAVLAFKGVGDALEAVNKYQLEPSAENFAAMQEKMAALGPEAREFVHFLDDITPRLQRLREEAQGGLLPGVQEGIDELLDRAPQVRRIIGEIAGASGDLAAQAGSELASRDFDEFFDFLENEAQPALMSFGRTVGNVLEGVANTWMSLDPLSDDFTQGLLDWSRDFADATENLDENEGFQRFLSYVQENGPQVMDTLGAIGNAFVELVQAAAPVGAASLPVIEALADVLAAVADSPAGPVLIGAAAGMSAISRAVGLFNAANGSALLGMLRGTAAEGRRAGAGATAASSGLARLNTAMAGLRTAGQTAAGLGAVGLAMTDLDDKAGLSNTAMGALMGTMIAPGWGTAIGAVGGGLRDLAAVNDDLEDAVMRANQALDSMSVDALRKSREELQTLLQEGRQADDSENFWSWDASLGDNLDYLGSKWRGFTGATGEAESKLRDVNGALRSTGDLGDILAGPLGVSAEAFRNATRSANQFREAVGSAFALLDKRSALREARQALRDFTEAMEDAPAKMRKNGPAYDRVQDALDNIAESSLTAAEHLRGMNRVDFLDRQRDSFIAAARRMDLTARQARRLADDLGLLDKSDANPKIGADNRGARRAVDEANEWFGKYGRQRPKATLDADDRPARGKVTSTERLLQQFVGPTRTVRIDADASGVQSGVASARSMLANIPDETVNIWVARHNVRSGPGGQGLTGADGMTVPKTGLPYADRWPALLADGEEVISNRHGEADRFRADRDAGRIPAYGDGGTARQLVASHPPAASHTEVRIVERVVERLPRTAVFEIPGMGQLMARVADDRIADDHEFWQRHNDRE